MTEISVEFLIVGGGIFGAYAAKILSPNSSVALVEIQPSLLSRASKVNQTRLHSGAHYLRAPKTAFDAQLHHDRFLIDHEFAMNKNFQHFYGIARQGSLTDSAGFERFCEWLKIDVQKKKFDLLDGNRVSDTYRVTEYSFDPFLLSRWYLNEIEKSKVSLHLNSEVIAAERFGDSWDVTVRGPSGLHFKIRAKTVINATYSNLNSVSRLFNLPETRMKHEYSEMLLLYVPELQNIAVTVMDGPFFSITPYGLTGLHVLSSVIYTHHSSTENQGKKLPCQVINGFCSVDAFDLCLSCRDKPKSTQRYMLNQLRSFMPNIGQIFVHGQVETMKSTWTGEDYRDERQTSIRKLSTGPNFYTVMSGKISNIYELEQILHDN